MKLSHLALSLSLLFASAAASAQNAGAPGAAMGLRAPPTPTQASGALARFMVGPGGRVRGLVLDNGTVVLLNPRTGAEVVSRVRVGQALRIDGFTRPGAATPAIFRATIRTADGTVIAQAPALPVGAREMGGGRGMGRGMGMDHHRGGILRGAQAQRMATLAPQTASGTVQQVLTGPRGAPRALLLSNNVTAYLSAGLKPQVQQRGVRVGETVRVSGRGSATPNGTGLIAESITFADGSTLNAPVAAPGAPPAR